MKYARIENGIVMEIIDDRGNDINTMFHKDIVSQLVPDSKEEAVQNGTWDGEKFGAVPKQELTWDDIRISRNKALRVTDHWAFVDAAQIMSDVMKEYRKLLRDIPQDYDKPEDVVFPIKPDEK